MFTCLDLYLMTHRILEYPHTAGKGVQILFKYPYMQNVMTQIRFFKDLTEATFIFHLMFFSVTWTVEEIWNRVPAWRHYCWIWFSGSQLSWACDSIMTSQMYVVPLQTFLFFQSCDSSHRSKCTSSDIFYMLHFIGSRFEWKWKITVV